MANPLLHQHVRQFFAHSVLRRFDRLDDAQVRFTFTPHTLYLATFAETIDKIERDTEGPDPELLRYAQVFERFARGSFAGVSKRTAALTSAAVYWLAGYTANARVIGRTLVASFPRRSTRQVFSAFLAGRLRGDESDVARALSTYARTGERDALTDGERAMATRVAASLRRPNPNEYAAALLFSHVLTRLPRVSFWGNIEGRTSASREIWSEYVAALDRLGSPILDLWPSQRAAIQKGLLDAQSTIVLRMPTSAGKTKMSELAIVNDVFTDGRRCVYIAPFRALVHEVEQSLTPLLTELRIPVASLYGGSETNELEVDLSNRARLVIATPEKLNAVLRASGQTLSSFSTVVLDEGHLLDAGTRGAAYEIQLARLLSRAAAAGSAASRTLFLSAVLPNSDEIAEWLGGNLDALAADSWHPTTTRIGVFRWRENGTPRLEFQSQPGQFDAVPFFVPRLIEPEEWTERNPTTRRMRTHHFPRRNDQASVAAALMIRYAVEGPVIVFAQQPAWAESIAKRLLDRAATARPITTNLVTPGNAEAIQELALFVENRIGADSMIARALRAGIGLHHGGVPQGIRILIEDAFRRQQLRALVATSTIAQGVNFPAKSVIVHSLPYGPTPIRDFWNLVGRAGRALKETDGEVVVLVSDTASERRLRRFLDARQVEPAESTILALVRQILDRYPQVTEATLVALARENEEIAELVRTIDGQLLEAMVEEGFAADPNAFDSLIDNLFATRQALRDAEGERLATGVRRLVHARRERITELIPNPQDRLRFSGTGLSPLGAQALDQAVRETAALIAATEEPTEDVLIELYRSLGGVPELGALAPERAARTTLAWIRDGTYREAMLAGEFEQIDEAVAFVEETLGYRVTWILDGYLHLWLTMVDDANLPGPPTWMRLLPQYIQYGVSTPHDLWAATLGIQDARFARWITTAYLAQQGQSPESFWDLLAWALANDEALVEQAAAVWPPLFARLLSSNLQRYRRLLEVAS